MPIYFNGQLVSLAGSLEEGSSEEPVYQTKDVTPSEAAQQITADDGYDALEQVNVGAISSTYVGTGVARKDSNSLTASGNTVTVPSGYYTSQATKSVSSGSVTVKDITVSTAGLITAGATVTAGYVSSSPGNKTKQLTTQAAKTVTPTKAEQTAVASGVYTTGAVKVGAIPAEYIVPSGSETKTANGTYDVTSLAQLIVNVPTGGSGGGSLPSGISAFDFGTITVSSAFTTTRQTFNHNLGVVPDLMIVWAETNVATTYSMLAAIRGNDFGWRSSAYNSHYAYHGNSTTTVTWANSNSTAYGISNMTASTFQLSSHSTSYYWRARNYNYIAIKFS